MAVGTVGVCAKMAPAIGVSVLAAVGTAEVRGIVDVRGPRQVVRRLTHAATVLGKSSWPLE
jgi:hypothetical protein